MKYRLKDGQLQKKLDTLSEVHQFSVRLQTTCERQFRDLSITFELNSDALL